MKIPKILSNSLIYTIIALIQKGISFFLLPLYTYYLMPSDYGVMSVLTSITNFISIFILFSFTSTATRFYYKRREHDYARQLWGTLILLVLINTVVIGTLCFVFHRFFLDPVLGEIPFSPYLVVGLLTTIVSPLYLFFQAYLQTIQKGKQYGTNSLLYFLLQVGLTVLFLVKFNWGVMGVLYANLITAVVFFIYAFFFFLKMKLEWRINKEIATSAFKYATPLFPHHLFAWSSGMIDRIMLNSLSSSTSSGLYSSAQQFGNIINTVEVNVNRAYAPWFYERIGRSENEETIKKLIYLLVTFYSVIAFVFSLYSKEIIHLMTAPSYHSIWVYVPFLCFANVFQGVYYVYSNFLFLDRTKYVFYCTLSSAVLIIALNFILIPILGVSGTVISAAVAIIARSMICLWLASRSPNFIRVNYITIAITIGLLFGISMIQYAIPSMGVIYGVIIKTISLLLACGVLVWLYKDSILLFVNIFLHAKTNKTDKED